MDASYFCLPYDFFFQPHIDQQQKSPQSQKEPETKLTQDPIPPSKQERDFSETFQTWLSFLSRVLAFLREWYDYFTVSVPKLPKPDIRKNYADSTSGASILFASTSIINKKAILDSSSETYMSLRECAKNEHHESDFALLPHVVVNLSDDIVIESLEVSNKEDFSESLFEITVEGSIDYPPTKWLSLGTLTHPNTILPVSGERMIRYLKLTLRGPKNRSNLYCTLTNVKVYGHSMNFVMRKSLTDLKSADDSKSGSEEPDEERWFFQAR